MKAEYLGEISFGSSTFLVSTMQTIETIKKSNKKVVIMGAGNIGFFAQKMLEEAGIEVYAFGDNSRRIQGKKLRGKIIYSSDSLFSREDVYLVIGVGASNIGTVRLQLMTHGVTDYSVFLITGFHAFEEEDRVLHATVLEAINMLCYYAEDMSSAMPEIGIAEGLDGGKLGNLNWLLGSTLWSHYAYLWGKELMETAGVKDVLEIGPGYGLMSYVYLELFRDICMDWALFSKYEVEKKVGFASGLWKVKEKFADRITELYGYIERDDFCLEKKYDLIILTEVFEHFALNPVHTMQKLANALNENGKILLTTPNWGHVHIYNSWKELRNAEEVDEQEYLKLLQCGHSYQYSTEELFEVFDRAGLRVDKYEASDSNNHNVLLAKK